MVQEGCPACSPNPAGLTRRAILSTGAALAAAPGRGNTNTHRSSALPKPNETFLLEPSWVLSWQDGRFKLLDDHTVVVSEGRIMEIRNGHRVGREQRIKCPGQLLLPGFISGHTHTNVVDLGRGVVGHPGRAGNPIRMGDLIDERDRDALTRYRLAESLRGGCTTRFEQALSLPQAKSHYSAAEAFGSREYLSAMTPGWSRLFPIWFRENDQVLFDSEAETLAEIAAISEWALANNSRDGLIRMQMGAHAPNTLTPKAMTAIATTATQLGHGIHTHLSQDAREIADIERLWGMKPTEWIDEFGWYDGPLIAAHLRGMDPAKELDILAKNEATFGYCPWQGGMDGMTVPRWWPEVLAAGMNSSIGLEFSNDYVENIKMAVFYGGARYSLLPHPARSPVPLKNPTLWDALRASTVNGARIVNRTDIGRIAVGALADLVSIDVTGFFVGAHTNPPQPVYNLLFANGLSVAHTMTQGRIQVYEGQLTIGSEESLAVAANAALERIWDAARESGWFDESTE